MYSNRVKATEFRFWRGCVNMVLFPFVYLIFSLAFRRNADLNIPFRVVDTHTKKRRIVPNIDEIFSYGFSIIRKTNL